LKRGYASLPLHYGKAPRWLFSRMVSLSRAIIETIRLDNPPDFIIEKLSDPFWFQSLGCILGFDWHSSGLTTTVMGALKEAIKGINSGIFIAGGKGRTSRKTPDELRTIGDRTGINSDALIYTSKITAKVDNNAIQDGYQLYHHTIIFDSLGNWGVIQQGMNTEKRMARRYHWLGKKVQDFVNEPHSGIISDSFTNPLNLIAQESNNARSEICNLSREKPDTLIKELNHLEELELPQRHQIFLKDMDPRRLYKIFLKTYEREAENFEKLLSMKGVGPKTIRALSLLSELLYGISPSYKDPARFSFAHGGKDGIPYPVDRETYENTINFLKVAIEKAKIGETEKIKAFKRLNTI